MAFSTKGFRDPWLLRRRAHKTRSYGSIGPTLMVSKSSATKICPSETGRRKERIQKLMTASQTCLQLTKEKEDLGERYVLVETAVQHCTSSGVSLPCTVVRDGGLRVAISFSPRCHLSPINSRRVKSDAARRVEKYPMRLAVLVGIRVGIRRAAQRVSETHGCIAGVLSIYNSTLVWSATVQQKKYVTPPKKKILEGGRFSSKPLSQHRTSSGASLPCEDMRDMRTSLCAISFSPRCGLSSIIY
jgi:hypothetical protein